VSARLLPRGITLQHTATHCIALQHTATLYSTLQHTATRCNTLQHNTAIHTMNMHVTAQLLLHGNTLLHTATHGRILQHTTPHCTILHHTATQLQHNAAKLQHIPFICASRLSFSHRAPHCNTTATQCSCNTYHLYAHHGSASPTEQQGAFWEFLCGVHFSRTLHDLPRRPPRIPITTGLIWNEHSTYIYIHTFLTNNSRSTPSTT